MCVLCDRRVWLVDHSGRYVLDTKVQDRSDRQHRDYRVQVNLEMLSFDQGDCHVRGGLETEQSDCHRGLVDVPLDARASFVIVKPGLLSAGWLVLAIAEEPESLAVVLRLSMTDSCHFLPVV